MSIRRSSYTPPLVVRRSSLPWRRRWVLIWSSTRGPEHDVRSRHWTRQAAWQRVDRYGPPPEPK